MTKERPMPKGGFMGCAAALREIADAIEEETPQFLDAMKCLVYALRCQERTLAELVADGGGHYQENSAARDLAMVRDALAVVVGKFDIDD